MTDVFLQMRGVLAGGGLRVLTYCKEGGDTIHDTDDLLLYATKKGGGDLGDRAIFLCYALMLNPSARRAMQEGRVDVTEAVTQVFTQWVTAGQTMMMEAVDSTWDTYDHVIDLLRATRADPEEALLLYPTMEEVGELSAEYLFHYLDAFVNDENIPTKEKIMDAVLDCLNVKTSRTECGEGEDGHEDDEEDDLPPGIKAVYNRLIQLVESGQAGR
jgi:hypothetical protein